MTPEDLERLVALGNATDVAAAAADLSEPQRKKLSKTAQILKRDIDKARWNWDGKSYIDASLERLKPFLKKGLLRTKKVTVGEQARAADLAVLAVGPLSQAKKINASLYGGQEEKEDLALKVLRDRRPEWIDEWIAAALGGESPSINWELFWTLVEDGICQKPTSEDYYRAMAQMLSGWSHLQLNERIPLSEFLASEPRLLDDVWKLFEVDTVAFAYDWYSGNDPAYETWPTAIFKLAERGAIDRGRLLDATLAGQTTGFKQNVLSGFAKLHEQLDPTPDELAARQPTYCDLMSVHLPQAVGFGVKMIKQLDKAKRLDDAAFVAAAGSVFDVTTKGPPKAVIGLLKKIVKRNPSLVPQASRALIDALNHPAEDVQGTAIDLLASLSERLDVVTFQEIADRLDDLPATVRPRAVELISKADADVAAMADADTASDFNDRLTQCRERAKAIEPRWRELASVDDALAAIENSAWPAPLDFETMDIPVLSGLESVTPIESLEELIDAVAHGIEQVESPIEVERILDGISRMCDQRPDDFDRRVAPLVKRIEKTKDSESNRGIANQHIAPPELARVVGTWLAGKADLAKPNWGDSSQAQDVTSFINTRLAALKQRIAAGKAAPLLAAPTHQRGWITPAAIVARWQETENRDSRPPKYEIIQALLRMAPDGRQAALEDTTSLTHPWARALRWALGSDDGPRKEDAEYANIWLAAGRARSPRERLVELATAGFEMDGPDAIEPAAFSWQTKVREQKYGHDNTTFRYSELDVSLHPKMDTKLTENSARPTVLLHAEGSKWRPFEAGAPWVYDWITMVWPANLDAFFATGSRSLVDRLDETSSTWEPNHAFIPPLFDVDRPWRDVARLMAVIGVAGRDQDVRGLAVDALVEAIADGRVHPATLGETLSRMTTPYWLKLNRLCENLAEIARVSPLHAWTVMGALERLLAEYSELPRDAHHLLALLRELHAQLGLPLQATAAAPLQTVKGASKTAKLAKSLRQYAPEQPNRAADEARLAALEARLDRAERWGGN